MKLRIACVVVGFLLLILSPAAQTANRSLSSSQVPPLIQFSNVAADEGGNTLSGVVSITFSLYNSQQGGEPLWSETQTNIQLDPTGHYSVQLGITKPNGVPATLFATGEPRWLGVQIAEQAEQPRVLLVSVPYALKAGDAATIGGLPPSAFALAEPRNGTAAASSTELAAARSVPPPTATDVTTTGGVVNYLPLFNAASTIVDSLAYQGSGAIHVPKLALQNTNTTGTQGVIEFGGVPFIHNYGPAGSFSSFFGRLAGNLTNTGLFLTGVGDYALLNDSSGSYNTALGYNAGATTTIGSNNTFLGYQANPTANNLSNATAIGANASVGESNALVLGGTGANAVSVGIGTATPNSTYALHVQGSGYFSNKVFVGTPTLDAGLDQSGVQQASLSVDDALGGYGLDAAAASGKGGGAGIYTQGGNADPQSTTALGGTAAQFQGGTGGGPGGDGIFALYGPGGTVSSTNGYAGDFSGDVDIDGTIYSSVNDLRVDHPLDPANQYLVHASVESSEMKNIYDGNVTTDSQGHATVQLPEWFGALNTDFRYQLTVIGQFAQAIVAREIENNRFDIRTSVPNVKVSWQVTGVRQDPYAKAHPLVVEQEKEARLRGYYIHPELYGATPQQKIAWARHPQMRKRILAATARQLAAAQKQSPPRN